ncbi:MAG TPA: hypothetical protein VGN83_17530 [Falsiroseomonas sp.]|jgi:hypothetical protein|nr:hypothetical protein [Falsiroseomonas sp.]
MMRTALFSLLLCSPGLVLAQELRPETQPRELRSGPDAPAASSQLPPSIPPGNAFPGPEGPVLAPPLPPAVANGPGVPEMTSTDHIRSVAPSPELGIGGVQVPGTGRNPLPSHEVLGGPPLPGAVLPDDSTGFFSSSDVIPPNVGELPMQTDTPPITR